MEQEQVQKILEGSLNIIGKFLDPKPLLPAMIADEALTNEEAQLIRSHVLKSDQCQQLIDILMLKPVKSYDVFMKELYKKRDDLHNKIKEIEREGGSSGACAAEIEQEQVQKILEGSLNIIGNFLDPKPLLPAMIADEALTNEEAQLIRSHVLKSDQCQQLIDILMLKPVKSYDVFMKELYKKRDDLHKKIKEIERDVVGGEDDPDVGKPVNPVSTSGKMDCDW